MNNAIKKVNKWIMYPDSLKSGRFGGYFTRDDVSQITGFFPVGQNIKFTDSRTPTIREGYELIGTELNNNTPIKRAWKYETRDGVEIEMRTYSDRVEYRIHGEMDDFALLKDGFTPGLEFGYGVIGKSSDTVGYVQFCNGIDDIHRWTGSFGKYASDNGVDEITISGSTSLSDLQFTSTGSIIINEEVITYTGITGQTFTGCSSVPAGPTVSDIIVQTPITTGFTATVKYSVALAHDGRIHARNESKKSVSFYSKLDDPFDWTTGAIDGDGGGKEIEQGGSVTAYGRDEGKIYIFKKRQIKTLEFVQGSTRVDVPKYGTLKPSDDKSTTVGALGQRSTFHSPNGIIFVTEDKELLHLTREASIDYPQLISLSDAIRPTFQLGIHDDASGIVFNSKVYYSYKQDSNSTYNDTVIVYDLIRQMWYPPIVGWNVNDWTILNGELHWHSSVSSNTYKLIENKTDNGLGFTTTLRSWSEHFGKPELQKRAGYCFLELYMQENTELAITILYDEGGFSGQDVYNIKASNNQDNLFSSDKYNMFGATSFGEERFGSNPDISGLKKYRFVLELKKNVEFYNVALQISTELAGINYELTRFGWFLEEILPLQPKKYLLSIT